MGITIHYDIQSTAKTVDKAKTLVEKMRQLAMDLPFEEVDDKLTILEGDQCNENKCPKDLHWLVIQSSTSVKIPWTVRKDKSGRRVGETTMQVRPEAIVAFNVIVGPGCEPLNIGLVRYPKFVEVGYKPEDDSRFKSEVESRSIFDSYRFDWIKWERWCKRNEREDLNINSGMKGVRPVYNPARLYETRKIKIPGSTWQWGSFCKTEYADEPGTGGIANFLRCHITAVTYLERVAKLPCVKVQINDEGDFGTHYCTDDWTVPEPHYYWHEATHSVEKLLESKGQSMAGIAALGGALNDMAKASGMGIEAPILNYPQFEHLEMKGRLELEKKGMDGFLAELDRIAKEARERQQHETETVATA